jgi:DNA-binding MurR/RpiR family transcriptional regulator
VTTQTLPPDTPIGRRIARAYPELTGALKRFADLVLGDPVTVARASIQAASAGIGVSVATANRFSRALGFKGYAEFRAELIRGFETAFEPVERLRVELSRTATSHETIRHSLEEDIRNLQLTLQNLTEDASTRAVDLILGARRRYVIGFSASAHLGALLANGLDRLVGDTQVVGNTDGAFGAAQHVSQFGAGDLVIAIAFPRYIRDTVELARFAVDRGIPLLAITDGPRSPLAAIARVTLYAATARAHASTSDASTLALIEALVAAVARRTPDAVAKADAFARFALPWFDAGFGPTEG